MNSLLKAACLAVYLVAVILLALHVLELLVAFKSVRRHPGPLIDSIGLTLLFGLLHGLPLAKAKHLEHGEAH